MYQLCIEFILFSVLVLIKHVGTSDISICSYPSVYIPVQKVIMYLAVMTYKFICHCSMQADNGVPSAQVYSTLLAVYLLQNEL